MGENGNGDDNLLVSTITEEYEHNGEEELKDVYKEGKQEAIEAVHEKEEVDDGPKIVDGDGEKNTEENGKEPDIQEQEAKEVEDENKEKEGSDDLEVTPEADDRVGPVENEEDGVENKDKDDKDSDLKHFVEEEIGNGEKDFALPANEDLKEADGTAEEDDPETEPAKKKVKGLEPLVHES